MTPDPLSTELPPAKRGFPWLTVLAVVFILFAGWLAWWKFSAQRNERELVTVVVPLTSLPGVERMGVLSPDGGRLVFAWNGDAADAAGFDLYVKPVGTGRPTRLTRSPAPAISAAWSPDGQQLAFARSSELDGGLFVMPSTGGAERKVAVATFARESLAQPAWSPDGRTLAYAAIEAGGTQGLRLLTLESLEDRPLDNPPGCWHAGAPVWVEGRLAFVCMTSIAAYEIYLADPESGAAPRRLAQLQGHPQGLAWSKVSRRIQVANDGGDGGGIWALELDGKLHPPEVAEDSLDGGVSTAKGRVVYAKRRQQIHIWRVRVEPAGTRRGRLISSTFEQLAPQYSPDDSRIAFQSNRSGTPEIWLADADGENAMTVTSIGGPPTGAPAWCADGRRLAFHSRESGASALYIVDLSERMPHRIETSQPNLALPVWSADCEWLLASDGEALYRVPAAGGAAQRFTEQRSWQAVIIADRVLFSVADPGGLVLWMKPLAGGPETPVPGMPRLSHADIWTANDVAIYFSLKLEGQLVIIRHDLAAHTVQPLAMLPNEPTPPGGPGLAVSRDGKSLLYTHTEDTQSDLALISEVTAPK